MKRILIFAVILQAGMAVAQGSLAGVNGDCTVGGQQVLTQGLPSTGTQQIGTSNVLPGAGVMASFPMCSVSVVLSGTANTASIFSDNLASPTPLSNPFVANVDGTFVFFTAQGTCYDITTSSGSGPMLPYSRTYSDVCLGTGTGGGGGGGGVGNGSAGQLAIYLVSGSTVAGDTNLTDLLNNLIYTGSGGITAPILATNGAGGGLVQVGSDGVHAGTVQLSGNTSVPALTANTASDIGPNSASFTAYAWQRPTAENGSAGLLHIAAASSHVSQESVSGVSIGDHTATGSPGATTFLRGDNTWAVPAGGGGTVGGSGTTNKIPVWTSSSALGDSSLTDSGTQITGALPIRLTTTSGASSSFSTLTPLAALCTGSASVLNNTNPTAGCPALQAIVSIPASGASTGNAMGFFSKCCVGPGSTVTLPLAIGSLSVNFGLPNVTAEMWGQVALSYPNVSSITIPINGGLFAAGIPASSSKTTTANYGVDAQTGIGSGAGSSINTTDATIHIESPTIATGTLTHHYGILIEDQTVAGSGTNSDPWGVRELGTAKNEFGGTVRIVPVAFSALPSCAAGIEGTQASINDSSTNTWGATITGSSTNHVLGYCDGTNWTVMGK